MKNENVTQKFVVGALWIASIVSTLYLLMLGWYNVPCADDYEYIPLVENEGLLNFVYCVYNGWQCRFSTFFVNGIFMILFGRANNLVGMTMLILSVGWLSLERLISGISNKYQWNLSGLIRWAFAILTTNIGVMSFLVSSTFYWFCALNYTIAIWATIFLVYFVFFASSAKWIRMLGIVLCSVYISGSAENYPPLVILIFGIVWIVTLWQQKTWRWWTIESTNYLFISLAILCIGFLVMLLGPGNKVRLELAGDASLLTGGISFFTFVKRTIKVVITHLLLYLSRGLYYIALFPVFVWIGTLIEDSGKSKQISLKQIFYIILLWISIVIISVATCIFGAGYCELRAFCFMTFILLSLFAYVGIRIGIGIRRKSLLSWTTIGSMIALSLSILYLFNVDIGLVKEYHQYVTNRNQQIAEKVQYYESNAIPREEQTPYVCAPFKSHWRPTLYSMTYYWVMKGLGEKNIVYTPQELLMVSEITEDPSDWRNQGLNQYFHADFDIICLPDAEK